METTSIELENKERLRVKIHFTYVEAVKHGEHRFSELKYPIDMSMGEAARRIDGSTKIEFSLKVATDPMIVVFDVRGYATIIGPSDLVIDITTPEGDSPPLIWKKIYQETMATIAFLSRFFEIPPPPTIMSD